MAGKGRAESAVADEQDTKRAIAREARRILDSDGLDGLSVRAAGKAAGLSSAAPYRRFAHGLPELLAWIAEEGFGELIAEMERAPVESDPRGQIVEIGLRWREAEPRWGLVGGEERDGRVDAGIAADGPSERYARCETDQGYCDRALKHVVLHDDQSRRRPGVLSGTNSHSADGLGVR